MRKLQLLLFWKSKTRSQELQEFAGVAGVAESEAGFPVSGCAVTQNSKLKTQNAKRKCRASY
jgi:hypothetical protein